MINDKKPDLAEFFEHIGHALSIASEHRQRARKSENAVEVKFWNSLHTSLGKACAEMHQPQYERIKNGKK